MHFLHPAEDKETRMLATTMFISHLQLKRAMAVKEPMFLLSLKDLVEGDRKHEEDP